MNKKELTKLLKPFGASVKDLKYCYEDFNTKALNDEPCPECGCEVLIMQNGESDCSECGHKKILPCAECPLNDIGECDWNKETLCSAFPKK